MSFFPECCPRCQGAWFRSPEGAMACACGFKSGYTCSWIELQDEYTRHFLTWKRDHCEYTSRPLLHPIKEEAFALRALFNNQSQFTKTAITLPLLPFNVTLERLLNLVTFH